MGSQEGQGRNELAQERTEWAEERTEWADQRTYLAQQRTFAGWIRTGLTSMAVGFGIIEFIRQPEPVWLTTSIGLSFIFVGALINGLAFVSYRKVTLHMRETHRPEMTLSVWWTGVITGGLILAAVGGLFLLL